MAFRDRIDEIALTSREVGRGMERVRVLNLLTELLPRITTRAEADLLKTIVAEISAWETSS